MAEEIKKTTTKKTASTKSSTSATKTAATEKKVEGTEAPKTTTKTATKKASTGMKKAKYQTRLQVKYNEEVRPTLFKKFEYKSIMQVPRLEKIVVNIGVGDATQDKKRVETSAAELALITGQKAVITHAKKSIATFKLREGDPIGCKVTLRGLRMYEFFDKLVSIGLPRVRDFRGVSKNSFDGRGNYTLGVKEQLVFPEIDYDKVEKIRGMDIVVVTTAKTDEEAYALLKELGMPFVR